MLACRNCRVSIAAAGGCVICNPIRKHLVVVGDSEEDRPSLSATGSEVVNALRRQLKAINKLLMDDSTNLEAEKRLMTLANTSAKVIESARKLQVDGMSAVENMSFAERAELFISWITELAPVSRQSLREMWDQWELEESKPINKLTANVLKETGRD